MKKWAFLLGFHLLVLKGAHAQGLDDVLSAKAHGMGGAYLALGLGTDPLYGNPAAMSRLPKYQMDLTLAWDTWTKYGFGSISLRDSQSNPVAAGIGYAFVSIGRGASRRTAHYSTLALSTPVSDKVFVGATLHHLVMAGARDGNGVTMDAGMLLKFGESFTVAVGGHNLIDIRNPELVRHYSLGLAFLAQSFALTADLRSDLGGQTPLQSYAFGGEYLFGTVPFRAGLLLEPLKHTQYLSIGMGVLNQSGGFDLAYRHELAGDRGRFLLVTFSF
jgi:hypothetical protein